MFWNLFPITGEKQLIALLSGEAAYQGEDSEDKTLKVGLFQNDVWTDSAVYVQLRSWIGVLLTLSSNSGTLITTFGIVVHESLDYEKN